MHEIGKFSAMAGAYVSGVSAISGPHGKPAEGAACRTPGFPRIRLSAAIPLPMIPVYGFPVH